MLGTPGENFNYLAPRFNGGMATQHSALVDENYIVVGANIDSNLHDKIKKGEYVDFSRLIPKERMMQSEEQKMELVCKGGQTFFVPAEREMVGITNFNRWEQAFRVFSNIYTQEHPDRASELIQYNHIIFTAASSVTWENVYLYDREFRMHLGSFPNRSWAVILQQAWSMCLKDRLSNSFNSFSQNHTLKHKKEKCKGFNKGLCTAGHSCRYEHRCMNCGNFGHGMHICRNKQNSGSETTSAQQSVPNSSTASK